MAESNPITPGAAKGVQAEQEPAVTSAPAVVAEIPVAASSGFEAATPVIPDATSGTATTNRFASTSPAGIHIDTSFLASDPVWFEDPRTTASEKNTYRNMRAVIRRAERLLSQFTPHITSSHRTAFDKL